MIDPKPWIEHLSNPLVLTGFGLFVFAALAAVVVNQRTNVSGNARLAVTMLFSLALIIVVGGLWLAGKNKSEPGQMPSLENEQKTAGALSPAVSSGKDVRIQYGTSVPPPKPGHSSTGSTGSTADSAQKSPSNIQETRGDQSPAIQSAGNVEIQYGGKP